MEFLSANGTPAASDIVIAVFLVLLTLVSFVALVCLICRNANRADAPGRKNTWLAVCLAAGFILRMIFALCIRGYRADYELFSDMFAHLEAHGTGGYYAGDANKVLYPAVYFIYLIFGGISNVTGLSDQALGMQFMIKLPMIIAELVTAYFLYRIARKYYNGFVALSVCAFASVCPMFFIGSSVWSSPMVFVAMFAVIACYFVARKNYSAAIAFFTAAAFSGKEGIYLFPAAAVFAVFHCVRAIKKYNNDKAASILAPEYRAAVTVPLAFVLSLVGAYLIGLAEIYSYNCNPFVYIYEFTLAPLAAWTDFTFNGLSVYMLFGRNGVAGGARFPVHLFACLFAGIILAVTVIVYFTKRNRATLVMLAAYSLYTMQVYYPGSTAAGFVSVFGVLTAAYALVRDKRILHILFVTGLAFVINSVTVMSVAGQLNNAEKYVLTGSSLVLSGGMSAVTIVCSVAVSIAHIYFTAVAINVGMTGVKKPLGSASGICGSLRELFERKKDVSENK